MDPEKLPSRISVLVADDNQPVREILLAILRTRFTVHKPVANGRQLIDAVTARPPDVVVSDVWMPVLGGVEAMRVLMEMGRTPPFVMVSADPQIAPECLAAGAVAFVCKTDLERDLIGAVMRAFEGRICLPVRTPRAQRARPRHSR